MNKITVYVELDNKTQEVNKASYELISKAYLLKKQALSLKQDEEIEIEAIVIGEILTESSIQQIKNSGANKLVFIKEQSLFNFNQVIYSKVFVEYIEKNPTDIILFGATMKGRILAPRITTSLKTGLVADCTALEMILKDDKIFLASTRPTFGSELMATILSRKNPQCATVRAGIFDRTEVENDNFEYVEYIPTAYSEPRIKLLSSVIEKVNSPDNFDGAKTVLCGGFGINSKDQEYYKKLQYIASKTKSKFGVTRKVVDYGYFDHVKQIGQTGSIINSDLYIAFGVSGAIQHIMGMKNCKTIIAINNDENAEIFKYCDYKIIADAKEIIDEIVGFIG